MTIKTRSKAAVMRKGSQFMFGERMATVTSMNIAKGTALVSFGDEQQILTLSQARVAYGLHAKQNPEPVTQPDNKQPDNKQPDNKQPDNKQPDNKQEPELEWHGRGEAMDEITNFDEMQFSFLGMEDFRVSVGKAAEGQSVAVFENERGQMVVQQEYVVKSVLKHAANSGQTKFFVRVHNGRVYAL